MADSDHIAQSQQVLGHMRLHGSITALEAMQEYGCMRLGARIWDLEKKGHSIKHGRVSKNGKHFAQYSLNNCNEHGQYSLL